jgi:hypothetical protein
MKAIFNSLSKLPVGHVVQVGNLRPIGNRPGLERAAVSFAGNRF